MPCASARRQVALVCAEATVDPTPKHVFSCLPRPPLAVGGEEARMGGGQALDVDRQNAGRLESEDACVCADRGTDASSCASLPGKGVSGLSGSTVMLLGGLEGDGALAAGNDSNNNVSSTNNSGSSSSSGSTSSGNGSNKNTADNDDSTTNKSNNVPVENKGQEASHGSSSWWDAVRARLVRGGGFTECRAADILARLEWAVEQEDAPTTRHDTANRYDDGSVGATLRAHDGTDAVTSGVAAAGQDSNQGIPSPPPAGQDDEEGERRRSRMLGHLAAVRVLCSEWGLLQATADEGGGGGGGTRARGGKGRDDGNGGGRSGRGNSDSAGGNWSGWEALALAIVTSCSQDRLSVCCWAVRPLMGGGGSGVGGGRTAGFYCAGLPRGEVIELLCLMLCSLRLLEGGGAAWAGQAEGSVRLKCDLLVCARVLENWDVR